MDKILENRIHKRQDGRWCLVYLPDAPDSKRRYIYGKTKKEVIGKVEKLEEAADSAASSREDTEKVIFKYRKRRVKQQDQQAESAITPDSDVSEKKSQWTLQAWIMFYLENYKKNELKQTTYDSYMGIWRSHILNSQLGKSKLENVNGEKLQQFYNEMSNNGYNAKTVRHMFILINMALKMAVKLRYITENANDFVSLPKRQAYEGKTLTAEEVRVIFEKAREEELYPIVALTICTGLRKGEVMALTWKNIDFREMELRVEGNLCRVRKDDEAERSKYEYKVLDPKTAKSRRIIPLTEKAMEALQIQKERQDSMKKKYDAIYDDKGFVFTEVDGSVIRQRGFMDKYHAFLKKYGISDIRFHDLRHTFATLLLEEGESPKVIQELLGHSTITTTMDIYTHVSKKGKKRAVSKLDNLF